MTNLVSWKLRGDDVWSKVHAHHRFDTETLCGDVVPSSTPNEAIVTVHTIAPPSASLCLRCAAIAMAPPDVERPEPTINRDVAAALERIDKTARALYVQEVATTNDDFDDLAKRAYHAADGLEIERMKRNAT